MPRARTRKGRVVQVTKWLRENFATAYPVKVQIFKQLPFDKSEDISGLSAPDRKRGYHAWCIKKKGHWFLSWLYYWGVRALGSSHFHWV